MTHPLIREQWLEYTEALEGGVPCLYNDIYGYTTIAYGNLCNSPGAVMALPLMHPGGIPATNAEKMIAFVKVHDDPVAKKNLTRTSWTYYAKLTPLRLTREGMTTLALAKLDSNDRELVKLIPGFTDMPLNAQLALHSWAWAVGSHARYPKMMRALAEGDFATAAVEIFIDESGPDHIIGTSDDNRGLKPRNIRNRILMKNAAWTRDMRLDPDVIEWTVDWQEQAAQNERPTSPTLYPHADPKYFDTKG